jgi:hypothetical protein
MDTLTIEYRNQIDGLLYVQFDADFNSKSKDVQLFCCDDPTGRHDRYVARKELNKNYIKIKEYKEESIYE